MEKDRAQVDLGVAVDVEEKLEEAAAQRQPKKRFVGRRQATEAASNGPNASVEDSGVIQGNSGYLIYSYTAINS
jgi:2-(3-amino-3-carboxypropyl)histidine synthase